jgi:hypothetical protein
MSSPAPSSADPVPGAPDPDRPLLFAHIPRTAGSTVKYVLRSTLGHARTLLDAHFYDTEGEDLCRFALVEGHLPVDFFAGRFGPDWHRNGLTMLRDPTARTVSQARHIRARPGPFQDVLRERVSDPETLFARVPRLANLQTKDLAGLHLDEPDVGDAALDTAKANLDRLAFGIAESFDSSMALLMERLRFGIPKFDAVNVSRGAHDDDLLSGDFHATATRHNDVDRRLYDYAAGRLRERIDDFARALLYTPADQAALRCRLRFRRQVVEHQIRLPADSVAAARISGWVLLDGRPADAVLLFVGNHVTPLVPRVERSDAARGTHTLHNRTAGVLGTLRVPPDATSIELVAVDRSRGLRSRRTLEIVRVEPDPLPARVKNRVGKLLGR